MPSSGACLNTEKLPVEFKYTGASGRPAPVEAGTTVTVTSGDATWESTGPNTGFLVSGDAAGDSTFSHTADADLGAGVVEITDSITLTVTGEQAAAVGVSFGAPVPK